MTDFSKYFVTYEQTDPPPIITDDYKEVKDSYDNYFIPLLNTQSTDILNGEIKLENPIRAVEAARQLIGTDFDQDSSKLVQYAYNQVGINIPTNTSNIGDRVSSLRDIQPGDLIYSKSNDVEMVSKVQNNQIYTIQSNNNRVVEAPLENKRIKDIRRVSNNSSNYIVQYFVNKGLTLNQAKGIYGNIMQESEGNIKAISGDGHYSYGIAQWTGKRKSKLFSMYGTRPSLDNQLDFLWWELNNTEKSSLEALKNANTVEEATRVFMRKFERPNPKYANFNRRLKYAKNA